MPNTKNSHHRKLSHTHFSFDYSTSSHLTVFPCISVQTTKPCIKPVKDQVLYSTEPNEIPRNLKHPWLAPDLFWNCRGKEENQKPKSLPTWSHFLRIFLKLLHSDYNASVFPFSCVVLRFTLFNYVEMAYRSYGGDSERRADSLSLVQSGNLIGPFSSNENSQYPGGDEGLPAPHLCIPSRLVSPQPPTHPMLYMS